MLHSHHGADGCRPHCIFIVIIVIVIIEGM